MQPYFLPYIGYWQLIASADYFVILDDVNFINRGWINRNKISINNTSCWMTLPLKKASQNKLIHEIEIQEDDGWKKRIIRTISCSYSKACSFNNIAELMHQTIDLAQGNLSLYLSNLIQEFCNRLGIMTTIIPSSRIFEKEGLKGQERIINICTRLGATSYVNLREGKNSMNM